MSSFISSGEHAKSARNGVARAAIAPGPPASAAAPAPTLNKPDTLPAQQLISPNTGLWQVSRVPWKTVKLFSSNSLPAWRSEEHTSELQSLMRISYAVFCLKTKKHKKTTKY